MKWYQKLTARASNAFRAFKGMSFAEVFSNLTGGMWTSTGVSTARLMQQMMGWCYKCIKKNSERIGAIPLRLYRKKGTGDKRDWEEIEEHPLLDLLNNPGDGKTRFELFQLWSMHDDLTGNAYWLLDGVEEEGDEPTGITVLNPRCVKVLTAHVNGEKQRSVTGFKYSEDAMETIYPPWKILHFRCPNPDNPFMGLGPTEAVLASIDTLNYANEWNKLFFKNGGHPGMILETDQVNPDIIKLLRDTFEDKYQGADKAHKTAVLPQGVKVAQNASSTQKDMDFSEMLTKMRDDILSAYGVPAVILGLGLGETMNRASAETLQYVYAAETVDPRMRRFVTTLNFGLVPLFGDDLIFDYDDIVPANQEMQIRQDESSLARAAYKSINEVRAERGYDPIEGGDVVQGSALTVPVGAPVKRAMPGKHDVKRIDGVFSMTNHKGRGSAPKKAMREMAASISANAVKNVMEVIKTAQAEQKAVRVAKIKEATKDITTVDWTPKWEALVKRASTYENEIKKAMAKYAVGMTDRAEGNVSDATKAVDVEQLLNRKDEVATVIKLLGPIFQQILIDEGTNAAEMVGEAFDATDERIQDALASGLKLMADRYTDETLKLLGDALQAGIDNGDSLPDLTKRVQEVGEFSASTRAETVAKTEAFRVANFSTREAWKQTGVVKELKWYTAEDEMVCPYCEPQNGVTVGIDESFFDKGDTLEGNNGEELKLDYATVESPPLHPNCRCYIRPETIET